MKHFYDNEYDSLKEYESHIGANYSEEDEKDDYDHGILWREEYAREYDDYDKSMLNHD